MKHGTHNGRLCKAEQGSIPTLLFATSDYRSSTASLWPLNDLTCKEGSQLQHPLDWLTNIYNIKLKTHFVPLRRNNSGTNFSVGFPSISGFGMARGSGLGALMDNTPYIASKLPRAIKRAHRTLNFPNHTVIELYTEFTQNLSNNNYTQWMCDGLGYFNLG